MYFCRMFWGWGGRGGVTLVIFSLFGGGGGAKFNICGLDHFASEPFNYHEGELPPNYRIAMPATVYTLLFTPVHELPKQALPRLPEIEFLGD